jgi:hypothetical protein
MRQTCFLIICLSFFCTIILPAQTQQSTSNKNTNSFGYLDKGDSISFIFGEQQTINVGTTQVELTDKRRGDIKQVNLEGEFNGWDNKNDHFQMFKLNNHLYVLTLSKNILGKKGEIRQFKFVLNHIYWIEPPPYAMNKITGKDGNTNLFIKL